MKALSYEQAKFLRYLCKVAMVTDCAGVCRDMECSWAELYELAERGYINLMVLPSHASASITELGESQLIKQEKTHDHPD